MSAFCRFCGRNTGTLLAECNCEKATAFREKQRADSQEATTPAEITEAIQQGEDAAKSSKDVYGILPKTTAQGETK